MEEGDDPYQILGVPSTATATEIRSAYRRLAIQHHPDKQRTAEDKERVTPLFVKISNAYELLSDPDERALYDDRQKQQSAAAATVDAAFTEHHHHFAFHDPFQLFAQLFHPSQVMPSGGGGSMFPTSMLGGNLFGMNSMGMMNMQDPFMNGFGGRMMNPLGMMNGGMGASSMMSPLGMMNGSMGASSMTTTFTSSTNVGTQSAVSVSTTTQIVNGRRETRTERIIRHADGTTERIVETPETVLINAEQHPRFAQLPETLEVSSDGTLSSTEASNSHKRTKHKNDTKKPKKRRKTNPPQEGDEDRPIVLE